MAILPVGIGSAEEGGYQIERSLRFDSSASASLSRTPASAGNRETWTWSGWVKRSALNGTRPLFGVVAGSCGDLVTRLQFDTSNRLIFQDFAACGAIYFNLITTQVFRDVSAWFHVVVAVDTTQATSTNRVKLYVNGSQVTAFGTATYPSLNHNTAWNSTLGKYIGREGDPNYFNGYLTEINFIDGSTPATTTRVVNGVTQTILTEFGEFNEDTGVWQPIEYTGSYGTNGFYLDFADNSSVAALGYDAAGSNDWSVNGISVTAGKDNDSLVDTPTNYGTDTGLGGEVRGNYATLNAVDYNATYLSLSNGNLQQTYGGVAAAAASRATMMLPTTGKWYWEVYINATGGGAGERIRAGITRPTTAISGNSIDSSATSYLQMSNGQKRTGTTDSTYGAGFSAGQYIQVLYDATAGAIYFGQNNSYANGTGSFNQAFSGAVAAFTSLSGEFMPCFITYGGADIAVNFGQRPFAYTAPSGFKALCTQNLPEPTIVDGGEYFNTVLYTGNGSTQSITGVGFQPDWVWAKSRSSAEANFILDAVRGATKNLYTNGLPGEFTQNTVTAFNADGFSVGSQASGVNTNTTPYVAWNWKAGNSNVTNTDGTITSTVRANPTAGFSIVTYTGTGATATVGHGLGVAPSMVIVKDRTAASSNRWAVYHAGMTNATYWMYLEGTPAQAVDTTVWDSTSPTSSVFSIGTSTNVGTNLHTYVAYCFAAIPGYSAFGKYTGNGSNNGVFVYTGFRPKWILMKRTDSTTGWNIYDTARDTYNAATKRLQPNLSNAENTVNGIIDILSNGWKFRNTNTDWDASGGTYIYAAFAENPFKYSLAR